MSKPQDPGGHPARPAKAGGPERRWWRRRWVQVSAGALLVLLVVAVIFGPKPAAVPVGTAGLSGSPTTSTATPAATHNTAQSASTAPAAPPPPTSPAASRAVTASSQRPVSPPAPTKPAAPPAPTKPAIPPAPVTPAPDTATSTVAVQTTPRALAALPTPTGSARYISALTQLDGLAVKGRAPTTGYSRAQFGQAWTDDVTVTGGHNGCDTRNDVLHRDLVSVTIKPGSHGCTVLAGTLTDPYTGATIGFTRGETTFSAVQIDHVVALSDAWQTGARQLSAAQRANLANDPINLQATDGPTNQQKSDADAASWLPPNKSYRCTYVARQIAVKHTYRLWVTPAEKTAMTQILADCPTGAAEHPATITPATAPAPTPISSSSPAASTSTQMAPPPAPKATHPAPPPQPQPAVDPPSPPDTTTPEPAATTTDNGDDGSGSGGAFYKNCDAARAAGVAPLHRGDPGYRPKLDRDGDGIACE